MVSIRLGRTRMRRQSRALDCGGRLRLGFERAAEAGLLRGGHPYGVDATVHFIVTLRERGTTTVKMGWGAEECRAMSDILGSMEWVRRGFELREADLGPFGPTSK